MVGSSLYIALGTGYWTVALSPGLHHSRSSPDSLWFEKGTKDRLKNRETAIFLRSRIQKL
ncbi:hypothetical protein C5167_035453 [Papaver somniferum]|uniref:Uncharacterized protein n=1 Tax=Papaver somniferum TaxID=3469 RepID=A0A4Y7KIV4_PAPSO|nr:hypothetical protein C5167_035453 [Papaver somniferum]